MMTTVENELENKEVEAPQSDVVTAPAQETADETAEDFSLPENFSKKAVIEGIVFASTTSVSLSTLVDLLGLPKEEIETCLDELMNDYASSDLHGFQLVKVAHGYQFRTKPELKGIMARLYEKKPPRLTQPTLEVLSIIAYKEPITRPEIERIRGVDCTAVLKTLLERELIEMKGRAELPGSPTVYATSPKFLEWFQIGGLEDLPPLQEVEILDRAIAEGSQNLLGLLNRDDGFKAEVLDEVDQTLQSVKTDANFLTPAQEEAAAAAAEKAQAEAAASAPQEETAPAAPKSPRKRKNIEGSPSQPDITA